MHASIAAMSDRAAAVNILIDRHIQRDDPPASFVNFGLEFNRTYTKFFSTPTRATVDETVADLIELVEFFESHGSDAMNIFSTDLFAYITAEMIEHAGRVKLTITNVTLEDLENARGKETKPVVHFKERDKTWVLNKTNAKDLAAVLGPETDNWRGARVVLTTERINAFGKYMPVIRLANVTPADKPKAASKPQADGPTYGDGSEVTAADLELYLAYVEEHGEPPQTIHDAVSWANDNLAEEATPAQPALVEAEAEQGNGAYQEAS